MRIFYLYPLLVPNDELLIMFDFSKLSLHKSIAKQFDLSFFSYQKVRECLEVE